MHETLVPIIHMYPALCSAWLKRCFKPACSAVSYASLQTALMLMLKPRFSTSLMRLTSWFSSSVLKTGGRVVGKVLGIPCFSLRARVDFGTPYCWATSQTPSLPSCVALLYLQQPLTQISTFPVLESMFSAYMPLLVCKIKQKNCFKLDAIGLIVSKFDN